MAKTQRNGLSDRAAGRPDLRRRRCRARSGDRPDRLQRLDHRCRCPASPAASRSTCSAAATPPAAAVDWVVGIEPGEQITTPLVLRRSGFDLGHHQLHYVSQEAKVNMTNMTPARRRTVAPAARSGTVGRGPDRRRIRPAPTATRRSSRSSATSTNPISDHVAGHPVMCSTDPRRSPACAASIRATAPTRSATSISKVSNIRGIDRGARKRSARRSFRSSPTRDCSTMRCSIVAARWADYTGAGTIWAYKGGLDVAASAAASPARHLFARRPRRQPVRALRPDRRRRHHHRPALPGRTAMRQRHPLFRRQSQRPAGGGRHLHRRRGRPAPLPARLLAVGRLVPDRDQPARSASSVRRRWSIAARKAPGRIAAT